MNKTTPPSVKLLELICCATSITPTGGGRIVAMLGEAFAEPSDAAHFSDSCAMEFSEITPDIEDLESVSAIPKEYIGPLPVGQLSDIPSLIRAAGGDDRCGLGAET